MNTNEAKPKLFFEERDFLEKIKDDDKAHEFYKNELIKIYTLFLVQRKVYTVNGKDPVSKSMETMTLHELIEFTKKLDHGTKDQIGNYFQEIMEKRKENEKS